MPLGTEGGKNSKAVTLDLGLGSKGLDRRVLGFGLEAQGVL